MRALALILALSACSAGYRVAAPKLGGPACPPQILVTLDAVGALALAGLGMLAIGAEHRARGALEIGLATGIVVGGVAAEVTCE